MNPLRSSLIRLVEIAIKNRDALLEAIRRDACDPDYQQQVASWPIVGDIYPGGRVTTLHATLFPRFDEADRAAKAAAISHAAEHLLPKIEAVSDAHRAMLDVAFAIGQGETSSSSPEWQAAEMAINEAIHNLLPFAALPTSWVSEVYRRIRELWDLLDDDKIAEIANRLATCVAKRRQFSAWFRDATTDEDKRLLAAGMWTGFPVVAGGVYRQWQAAKGSDRYRLIASHAETFVERMRKDHEQAVRFIAGDCETFGISSQALWEAGRVCREIFASTGLAMQSGAVSCDWPDCLGDGRYRLPQAMQDAIREGEAVYQSWLTKASARPAKGGNKEPRRDYTERSEGEWDDLLAAFESEQKDNEGLTETAFARSEDIERSTLARGLERARKRREDNRKRRR